MLINTSPFTGEDFLMQGIKNGGVTKSQIPFINIFPAKSQPTSSL